jgi:hypothetical protein
MWPFSLSEQKVNEQQTEPPTEVERIEARIREDRRKARSDALMVIGTFMAAVAAGCSAFAAFRQEQATFTSGLYTKQLDLLATLLQKVISVTPELVDIRQELVDPSNHGGLSPSEQTKIKARLVTVLTTRDQIDTMYGLALLLLPELTFLT